MLGNNCILANLSNCYHFLLVDLLSLFTRGSVRGLGWPFGDFFSSTGMERGPQKQHFAKLGNVKHYESFPTPGHRHARSSFAKVASHEKLHRPTT